MLKKNDLVEFRIEDMSASGEGIGRYEGMTFFVKDALIGDTVRARVTKLKKSYGYARMEELLAPSDHRVSPRCALHRRCGGCQIQAMDYEAQLAYKQNKVRGNLIRIGGFSEELVDEVMLPIVGMEEPYRYRNKAQFPVGRDREGRLIAGFYASRTHQIIPVTDCVLGVAQNREILDCVLAYMEENHIEPYDEKTGKGMVRHVLIRYGFSTNELMVCVVINGERLPASERLIERLCGIAGMTSIAVNQNTKNTNVILGDVTKTIWGQAYITDYIHLRSCETGTFAPTGEAIAYHISPQSFYQVNPIQTEKLYSLALDYAGLTGTETVWDLYCGIGTISLFLAQKAGKVYGVEVVPQAIMDARSNAKLNGITNAEFFVGRAEDVLPEFYEREVGKVYGVEVVPQAIMDARSNAKLNGITNAEFFVGRAEDVLPEFYEREVEGTGDVPPQTLKQAACWDGAADAGQTMEAEKDAKGQQSDLRHPDVIVVDPPRKGCDERCLETMLKMQPTRIVYVSCDSATLARDLRILCDGGYEVRKVRAVDQFGHTVHVETVCLLTYGETGMNCRGKIDERRGNCHWNM